MLINTEEIKANMIRTTLEAITLTIVGVTSSGTSAIGLATMQASENANTLSVDTWMPLGLFLGGIAMTATVVWKVSAHKTKTDNKLEMLEEKIKQLEKNQRE
tara:strand:- start:306 stop:611 length:306 start_codon:yes stop_codon:yes gene_type:complete